MNQKEFESELEHRVCREFAGMSNASLQKYWCDGVMLGSFLIDDPRPRVLGYAWICKGHMQEDWRLELLLPFKPKSQSAIQWAQLLPPDNVTKWMSVDCKKKLIQIEPAAALPDLQ